MLQQCLPILFTDSSPSSAVLLLQLRHRHAVVSFVGPLCVGPTRFPTPLRFSLHTSPSPPPLVTLGHSTFIEEKESKGGLKMKRQRKSERDINDIDRLSDLPDFVLLYIMECMDIKDAVQTCILSKRWKNLWKSITSLTLRCLDPERYCIRVPRLDNTDLSFSKFVSRILSDRDGSLPLHNLDFGHRDTPEITLLEVMEYAASHDVQQFKIRVKFDPPHTFELPLSIFCCRSLTFLTLDFWIFSGANNKVKFPKSMNLPALKSLHLRYVTFSTNDNGCVEPFSTCKMLNTLLVVGCYLPLDAQVLYITNSNLSTLTIGSSFAYQAIQRYNVVLSTPKLSSVTAQGCPIYQVSSVCSLPFLEKSKYRCLLESL